MRHIHESCLAACREHSARRDRCGICRARYRTATIGGHERLWEWGAHLALFAAVVAVGVAAGHAEGQKRQAAAQAQRRRREQRQAAAVLGLSAAVGAAAELTKRVAAASAALGRNRRAPGL